jgi:hypothetical protein
MMYYYHDDDDVEGDDCEYLMDNSVDDCQSHNFSVGETRKDPHYQLE